ncbi:MAG: hypothetical protein WCV82_00555 [Candidatus Paceibacterota bacterium]
MSKYEIARSLRKEIRRINRVIDMKIIQGLPYYNESRRHRFLTSQLKHLVPERLGWFSRPMSFASLFMF